MDEFYKDYKVFIPKLKDSEKKIRNDISNYKQIINNNQNTIDVEKNIKDELNEFKALQNKLNTAYSNRNVPSEMPSMAIESRQKEIQTFGIHYEEMEKAFKSIQENKYKFKGEITEDYSKKEEYKNMSTQEMMLLQKRKLNDQDKQLEDITLDVKKGTVLAQNAGHVIKEQNKQLDQINEDIDRTKDRMNTLTARFEKYVAKYSVCKMIIILIIELAIAVVCGLLLF